MRCMMFGVVMLMLASVGRGAGAARRQRRW
jgi:hypothetical protein